MKLLSSFVLVVVLALSTEAAASPGLRGDVEIDPTAYALAGYSLHVGVAHGHLRFDLGNFAMALPQVVHGDDGFDVAFDGFGAKVQYFRRGDQRGWFAGVDGGVVRVRARRQGTDLAVTDRQVQLGVQAGYRFALPAGFYASTWLGVGHAFSADDVTLAGATYEAMSLTVFPAVHLGYRFP
jgi:hypothetical protein